MNPCGDPTPQESLAQGSFYEEATMKTDDQELAMQVQAALHESGWTIGDGRDPSIASKLFRTVNVMDAAFAYLSHGDGYNHLLSFCFISEGQNRTATDCMLIPVNSGASKVRELTMAAAHQAEQSINQSFAVRMA